MMTDDELRKELNQMAPEERACALAILAEEYVLDFPYYSKVVFSAPRVTTPAAGTYTLAIGAFRRAFSYGYATAGGTQAGFPVNYQPTLADTNLAVPQSTISGETVSVTGIALQPVPSWPSGVVGEGLGVATTRYSDAGLLALVSDATSVVLQLNSAKEQYRMGIIPMCPGAGGLEGSGPDNLAVQPIDGGRGGMGYARNGRPDIDNCFQMPSGLQWNPAGKRDAMLDLRFELERPVQAFTGGSVENNLANEVGAAGIRGFAYPEEIGFGLMTYLKGRVRSLRSGMS